MLGAVLGFAARRREPRALDALLLVAYSLGLGLSFLVVGLAMGKLTRTLDVVQAPLARDHVRAPPAILAMFGIILLTDQLPTVTARISDALRDNGFGWLVDIG